jgi:hypothetical protein
MATMSARQLRRQLRNALNVRRWTLRQKIGVGVWIPVAIVAFALFTGPSRSSGSASADNATTTSTTFEVAMPKLQPIVPPALSKAPKTSLHERIVKWINGVPPRRSPAEKLALLRYNRAARNRNFVALHNAGPKVLILHPGSARVGHR